MFKQKNIRQFFDNVYKHKEYVFLGLLLILHLFTRFYLLEERLQFGWDQVDNAWVAAKNILTDHNFPTTGMVAKGNTGFHIGPLYYYFVAVVYFLFDKNPIATGMIAGITSIITFFVIYLLTKKLFNYKIALLAVFIDTASYFIIYGDRGQWPVNFIVPLSFLVFYSLYKVLSGELKQLPYLAVWIGLSLHVHFTSIFYGIIVLLSLPLFPLKKLKVKYVLFALFLFLIIVSPMIFSEITSKHSESSNLGKYLQTYYHGIHFTRMMQLIHDAFIEFTLILRQSSVFLGPLLLLAFNALYIFPKPTKNKLIFVYLEILWFLVPWIVFSTYKGELTNYYFYLTRPLVLMVISYLLYRAFIVKNIIPKLLVIIYLSYFSYININDFMSEKPSEYTKKVGEVKEKIQRGEQIKLYENIPESYLFYYYTYELTVLQ